MTARNEVRVLGPDDGEILGADGSFDRFMIGGGDTDGRFAMVEHRIPAGSLAAPVHRHSREDEFSFVLEGRMAALLGDREVEARVGELVFKPRGQWHTFWNPGSEPLRLLELISPAGFEQLFRDAEERRVRQESGGGEGDAEAPSLSERYAIDVDMDETRRIVAEHGVAFA